MSEKLNLPEHEASTAQIMETRVFSAAMEAAGRYAGSKRKVFRILEHAFDKLRDVSLRHRLKQAFQEKVAVMMRMLIAYYRGYYRKPPLQAIVRIIGGLVYFIWVLDFIPDFMPVLGLADDIAVIVWVYNGIQIELDEFAEWESDNR